MMQTTRIPWGDVLALVTTRFGLAVAWRNDTQLARRLEGFAATEAGSALDMLKAAELTTDPKLRRLFFRHATDEARHALMFREIARRVHPDGKRALPEHLLIAASRQNLFARLGLLRFMAFVHLSERRAARQFALIRKHFAERPEIVNLFDRVLRDERFHVAYSGHLLRVWRRSNGRAVRWALLRTRAQGAWEAWRRNGRTLGDAFARVLTSALWIFVLPLFALVERLRRPSPSGWQVPSLGVGDIDAARKEG